VQASACREFTTVLAPGSNVYHYNHIHVDLMRRARRPIICQPAAMSGEEVAARAGGRNPYASMARGEPAVTGSLGGSRPAPHHHKAADEDEGEDD
jgi:Extensin-like protein C-terminus